MKENHLSNESRKESTGGGVPYMRGVPAPTSAPMIAAFGVTLLFMGLVTSRIVMVVGIACMLVGFVGWIKVVFPTEALEELPEGSEIPEPAPQFKAAASRARASLPERVHPYRAGVWGGLVGGVSMAAVAIGWGILKHKSVWMPVNLLAGVFLPSVEAAQVDSLVAFHLDWFLIALLIHVVGCMIVGLVYAITLPIAPGRPILFGGIVAPILWTGVLHSSIGIINPSLEVFVSWPWFVASQCAFGATCGWVINTWAKVPSSLSLQERLGFESNKEEGS